LIHPKINAKILYKFRFKIIFAIKKMIKEECDTLEFIEV